MTTSPLPATLSKQTSVAEFSDVKAQIERHLADAIADANKSRDIKLEGLSSERAELVLAISILKAERSGDIKNERSK